MKVLHILASPCQLHLPLPGSSFPLLASVDFPRPAGQKKQAEWSGGASGIRSAASVISALSGVVANGRQTLALVSSTPSKIPYGGFSPVRLQTSARRGHLPAGCPTVISRHGPSVRVQRCSRSPGLRPGGITPSRPRTASPVALGSPTGSSIRSAHCLLWPHPSL